MTHENISLQSISIENTNISRHKHAKKAYKASLLFDYQFSLNNFPVEIVESMQALDPIHAVRISETELKFFGGWFWYEEALNKGIENYSVIEYRKAKKDLIERTSWMYLISQNLRCLNKNTNLAQYANLIDKIPSNFTKRLFGEHWNSRSSSVIVQKLSSQSREAMRHQFRKLNKTNE